MSDENFTTIKPAAELAPYISYYYFHQSRSEEFDKTFTYYPHYKHALTAYQHSAHNLLNDLTAEISPNPLCSPIVYSKLQKEIGIVHLKGQFQKMGVVFQPLGIHHFINEDYGELFSEKINYVRYFGETFDAVLERIFSSETIPEKATLLNTFFQENFVGFDENRLKKAIKLIIESEGSISVNDLAEILKISRKTLLRLFRRHLDCSVEDYKKLVKFRSALTKIQTQKAINLTQISTENYFDQSDFIKQFKKLTQLPPKKFLAAVTQLGSEDTVWNFKR